MARKVEGAAFTIETMGVEGRQLARNVGYLTTLPKVPSPSNVKTSSKGVKHLISECQAAKPPSHRRSDDGFHSRDPFDDGKRSLKKISPRVVAPWFFLELDLDFRVLGQRFRK